MAHGYVIQRRKPGCGSAPLAADFRLGSGEPGGESYLEVDLATLLYLGIRLPQIELEGRKGVSRYMDETTD